MRAVKGVSFCMKLYTQCRVVVYPKVADSFCTYAHKEISIESLKPPNALSSVFVGKTRKRRKRIQVGHRYLSYVYNVNLV